MSPQSEETKKQWGIMGVAVPGGLLLGMGVGFLIGNVFLVLKITTEYTE